MSSLEDMDSIDGYTNELANKISENEGEVAVRDQKVLELAEENCNLAIDVDLHKRSRADFDGTNMDLEDQKKSYDVCIGAHNKLLAQNQSLDCELRETRADLRNLQQTSNLSDRKAN